MKRCYLLLLISVVLGFTVFSCYSCTPSQEGSENEEPNNKEEGKEQENNQDQSKEGSTYKFVASTLQGKWNAGDQIYVHGSIGSWHEVITLKAEDISADGKIASAILGNVTEKPATPDGLYAGWPDQAVKHIKTKIGSKTTFESCDGLLTVAYLAGDTFNFIDVSSAISFTVGGGDYNQFALCANDRIGMNITSLEVDHTSASTSMAQVSDGYPFMYGTLEPGKEVKIWMPGSMTMKGLTLYFGKNDNWIGSYTVSSDVKLEAGRTKALGTVTASAYSGPAPKMPRMGEKTKYSGLKIAELSGLCVSADNEFIWGVGDEGQIAKISFDGKVIDCVKLRTKGSGDKEYSVDAEGVTLDPRNGDILISGEPGSLMRIPAADIPTLFDSEKYYGIKTVFEVAKASGYGNSGTEGVTYYKDGIVILGAQHNSHIFFYNLDNKQLLWDYMMWDEDLVAEIAGLYYDPLTDWLWIIDSEPKKGTSVMKVYVYQIVQQSTTQYSLNLLGAYPITNSSNPESITVDHNNSCIWVGDDLSDDLSSLYKYTFEGLDDFIIN